MNYIVENMENRFYSILEGSKSLNDGKGQKMCRLYFTYDITVTLFSNADKSAQYNKLCYLYRVLEELCKSKPQDCLIDNYYNLSNASGIDTGGFT